ncbi:MAG: hypothetical protein RL528_1505 [Bacteroidota bacterium]|jgi:hypothetical protein
MKISVVRSWRIESKYISDYIDAVFKCELKINKELALNYCQSKSNFHLLF